MADPNDEDDFYSLEQLLLEEGLLTCTTTNTNSSMPSSETPTSSFSTETAAIQTTAATNQRVRRNKPELPLEKRRFIVDSLLAMEQESTLPRGSMKDLAKSIGVHKSTISRFAANVKKQRNRGNVVDVRSKKKGKYGRKSEPRSEDWLQSVPLHLRTTVKSFAGYLKVGHMTVHRLIKKGLKKQAQKSSKNRQAGTWETKAMQNVNRHVIRKMLLNKVIPSIKQGWPDHSHQEIFIQWDNARPHQIPTDSEFIQACTSDGFNIQMIFQPLQSPDLNVLDLTLFGSIQSIQYQSFPQNLDDLIQKVEEAYATFNPRVNKFSWLTLQRVMVKILGDNGGNNYKIPHNGKERLERLGILPDNVEVPQEVIDKAVNYLNERLVQVQNDNDSIEFEEDEEVGVDID